MSDNVKAMIDALQSGDTAVANTAFHDELQSRVATALDAEKIGLAASVYGSEDEIEADIEDQIEMDLDAEEQDVELNMEDDVELDVEDSEEEY